MPISRAEQYRNLIRTAGGGIAPPPMQGPATGQRWGIAGRVLPPGGALPPPLPPQVGNVVQRYGYAGPTLPGQVPLTPGAVPPPMPPKTRFGIGEVAPYPQQAPAGGQRFGIGGPIGDYLARRRRVAPMARGGSRGGLY